MNIKQFKKLNIGICGCGYWASNIIKSLEEESFENVFVYDFDNKKLNNIKSKFSFLIICKSFNELISKKLDCVLLVTPTSTHFSLGKKY